MILDQSVTINSEGVSEYVISIERRHSICQMISTGTVILSPDFTTNVNPYEDIIIHEQGTRVFRGYTQRQSRDKLSGEVMVDFADPAIRLQDYFLTFKNRTNGETVQTWIQAFCNLAGVTVVFDTTLPMTLGIGDQATEWVNMSVMSVIEGLIAVGGYWMYSDPDGDIHFSQGHYVPLTTSLSTGDNIIRSERQESITPSRNRAVVFGRDEIVGEATKNLAELAGVVKTAIIASSYIYQKDTADTLADELVGAFSRVLDVKTLEVEGDPNITLAQFAAVDDDWLDIDRNCQITTVESSMSKDGYIMRVKLDEFCPKIWGYRDNIIPDSNTQLVSYNPTNGCYLLPPTGSVWINNNFGLAAAEIGANSGIYRSSNSRFVKVNSGMFSKPGFDVAWAEETLTDPPNNWNDDPAPTVADLTWVQVLKDPNNENIYYALAEWQNDGDVWRCWIIKTEDGGASWTWGGAIGSSEYVYGTVTSTSWSHNGGSWTDSTAPTANLAADDGVACVMSTQYDGGAVFIEAHGHIYIDLGAEYSLSSATVDVSGNNLDFEITALNHTPVGTNASRDVARLSAKKLIGDGYTTRIDKTPSVAVHGAAPNGIIVRYLDYYWRRLNDNGQLGAGWANTLDLDYVRAYVGDQAQFTARGIWMDIDQTDGSTLWLTIINITDEKIQLQRYDTSNLSVVQTTDLEDATEQNVIDKEYIAYPGTTALNKEHLHIFGRVECVDDTDTRTPVFIAGSGVQLQKSEDGGATFTPTISGWYEDYCGAFTDQQSVFYAIRNNNLNRIYKSEEGVLTLQGDTPFNTYVGSFTASDIPGQLAIGSRDASSVYQSEDDGITWTTKTLNLPAGSFISGLQYITE